MAPVGELDGATGLANGHVALLLSRGQRSFFF